MRLTLNNGRTFTIKIHYDTTPRSIVKYDEYGRFIETTWQERRSTVSIEEYFDQPITSKVYKGYAYCSYKDQFDKKVGRSIAYINAIDNMYDDLLINGKEADELSNFDLNVWEQDNRE